jgi:hypothetical protein
MFCTQRLVALERSECLPVFPSSSPLVALERSLSTKRAGAQDPFVKR